MLCPEVWNFRAPESKFKVEKGVFNYDSCVNNIKKLNYNHLISVVLPDTFKIPNNLNELLTTDCEYYKITNLPIGKLIEEDFINSFIKKGCFSGLSINRRIDCEDCVCVTASGIIVLSLTKETYQTLGIEGKVSHFHRNTRARYIVHVDVFKTGKKNYKRTKECLNKLNFTLIITWEPPSEDICPSSVAKYFYDLNYNVKVCNTKYNVRTDYSVKVPAFDLENIEEFVEWLGAASLECDLNNDRTETYLSTYDIPENSLEYGQIKFLQWRGFFVPNQIEKLFEELTKYCKSVNVPWVSLYVQGFSDSSINWGLQEHHYYVHGDNSYVIAFNQDNYFLYKQMSSQKYYT